jgi:hypothetical protein
MNSLNLDPTQFRGGVGLWGALPAVYDTTKYPLDRGVHVHARKRPNGQKQIDDSFSEVDVLTQSSVVRVTEVAAKAFICGAIFGLNLKDLRCPHCGEPHLDLDEFSVRPHNDHLCLRCRLPFQDSELSVGNPIIAAKQALGDASVVRPTNKVTRAISIKQDAPYCSGGIRIWGTNPAILWTATREEEDGIHVHCHEAGNDVPGVDQTYGAVEIDGISIDAQQVRRYMVQNALGFLRPAIVCLVCPTCGRSHFDASPPEELNPHLTHKCACGVEMTAGCPAISNPLHQILSVLYASSARVGLGKNPYLP